MLLECIRYKPVDVGTFCGFADMYIQDLGIEILGCTLYKKDGKRWLNPPVRNFTAPDGEEKYSPIIRFREQKNFKDFCTLSKEAIDTFLAKENTV
jgi:hypothetical protein